MSRRRAITYLLDSSFWLSLAIQGHVNNEKASVFFGEANDSRSLLFCRATQQSFLRLVTTASVLRLYNEPPLTNAQAWQLYEDFESNPKVAFVSESVALDDLWRELSGVKTASPKVWMDSYLAAFAIAQGHTLVTFDSDFKQFAGLKLQLLV